MIKINQKIKFLCIFVVLFSFSDATLSHKNKKEQSSNKKSVSGKLEPTVFERGLVTESTKWKQIVENHAGYHVNKISPKITTLAYVTPWNNHGYDIAEIYRAQFTFISPVWLQLKRVQGGAFWEVTGLHDVDQGWMKRLREGHDVRAPVIVPRLIFEGWSAAAYQQLVDTEDMRRRLSKDLLQLIKENHFGGLVLEVWSQLPTRELHRTMPAVLADISGSLKSAGHSIILVIPPPVYDRGQAGIFQRSEFEALAPHVSFFSLMTYDFSSFQSPGPNSPLWWVEQCVKALVPDVTSQLRKKLLVGLNLYGLDHSLTGGSHIMGPRVVEVLAQHKPKIRYDERAAEHFFEYSSGGRHTVFYPTLHSIHKRVSLAESLNTGVSLWEVGQGLDYFYELLEGE